jgi:hypothetical protein
MQSRKIGENVQKKWRISRNVLRNSGSEKFDLTSGPVIFSGQNSEDKRRRRSNKVSGQRITTKETKI